MKTLTVRLPDPLVREIDAESRARRLSRSDVIRERLTAPSSAAPAAASNLDAIRDMIGSVERLPGDLSATKKSKLKAMGYGRKRAR